MSAASHRPKLAGALGGNLVLPEGSSLDLELLRDVASVSNRAHQALGTQLLLLERDSVVLGIEQPPGEPAVGSASDEWPNGVVTSLLDHGCAMAALVCLDDPALFGGSLGLHVQYLRRTNATASLHVRATCEWRDDAIVRLRAVAFHPDRPDEVVATASAIVAVSA